MTIDHRAGNIKGRGFNRDFGSGEKLKNHRLLAGIVGAVNFDLSHRRVWPRFGRVNRQICFCPTDVACDEHGLVPHCRPNLCVALAVWSRSIEYIKWDEKVADEGHKKFFVVKAGSAGLYLDETAGTPLVTWTKGDHFGEMAFLEGPEHPTYAVSVKAVTSLDLIVLDRADFTGLAESLGALQRDLEQALFARRAYARFTTMVGKNPALRALTISDVMTHSVQTLPLDLSLAKAVEKFQDGQAAFPVTEGEILRGYCSRWELLSALGRGLPFETPVRDFMRQAPPSVRENLGVLVASADFLRSDVDIMPSSRPMAAAD